MDGDGNEIPSDAIEDALAFNCEVCDYPILASSMEGKSQLGSWNHGFQ